MVEREELERLIIDHVINDYRTYVDEDIIAAAIIAAGWRKLVVDDAMVRRAMNELWGSGIDIPSTRMRAALTAAINPEENP